MAKVLSSISGNLISAASAGFAPTNSADVSAIASAYQVVSATATQLYAGTAFLTSVNGAPVSASRAGNAANASMATSAYYDGTGRLISSLPDAATVSAIASSYADDKLDKTAEVVTATAGDGTYVTSINGMGISGQGGGGGIDSATCSAIASSYAESAVSSKLDTSAQVVTATAGDGTYVTSINGMGISGQGGGGGGVVTATGSASALTGYWPYTTSYLVSSINGSALLPYGFSALSGYSSLWNSTRTTVIDNSANWTSVYDTVYSNSASWSGSTGGGSVTSPSGTILVINDNEVEGTNSAVLTVGEAGFEEVLRAYNYFFSTSMQGLTNDAVPDTGATLMVQLQQAAYTDFQVILSGNGENGWASASGTIPRGNLTASVPLEGITGAISASANNWVSLLNDQLTAKKDGSILVTGVGELAWKSAVDNVTNTVSANSATWGGGGGVDSATVSAIASAYGYSALSSIYAGLGISYGGADDPFFGVNFDRAGPLGTDDNNVLICKTDGTTIGVNTAGELVSLVGGGVDSATVSAIASAYQVVSSLGDDGTYITSINGMGISGQGGGATGDYVEKSAHNVAIGSDNTARMIAFAQGERNSTTFYSFAQGQSNSADNCSFAQGQYNSAVFCSFAQGQYNMAYTNSLAQGSFNTANSISFALGDSISAINTAAVFGQNNLRGDGSTSTGDSAAFAIGDGTAWNARHDLMLVTKDGEITMYSSTADTAGTGIMSSIRAISAAAAGGGVDSATVSAIASSYAESAASSKLDTSAQVVTSTAMAYDMDGYAWRTEINGLGISAARAYSASYANTAGTAYSSDFASSSDKAIYDTDGRFLSSLTDSATVSAIASSYAESAVSGKMDSSAMTSYALSSDVSGTVDLVSTQSANWGGSALALSAGPGISLTQSGNTLIAAVDNDYIVTTVETVGSYNVTTAYTEVTNTFSKEGYKPIAWEHKFEWAADLDFNEERTVVNTSNQLVYQGFIKNRGNDTKSITFKLHVSWVKVS